MIQPPPGFTLDASPSSPFQNPPSPADSELRPLSPVPPPPGFEVDDAPLSEAEARVRLKLDRSEKKPGLLSDAYNLAKSGVASLIGGVGRLAHELTPDSSVAVNPHEDMSGGLNIPPGYGKRVDGTDKGDGYLGPIRRDDGKTMTELSIGMDFGQGEQEVPAIVPTLTPDEVEYLRRGGDPLRNEAIMRKAGDHARERLAAGKSPFADPEEIPQGNVEMPGLAMSKWAQREQQRIFEKLTPEQRDAMQRIEQFDAADSSTYGNLFKNPRGVYGMMVQSAPMMLPGMAAARASIALGGGVKAAAAAAAAAEGTIGGVVGGDQIAQMIEGATAEELAQSPRYQELLAESGDPERAKAALASELYGWGALSTGALTAILGAPAGAIYGRMFGGEAAQSLFGNMARGAVTESLEEAGQSGAETLVQNAAAQQSIDPNRKISEDVGTNMMVGAAAAAPMGAGFGALAPTAPGKTAPSPQPATPPPAAPPADPGIVVNDVTPDPIVAPPPPEPATRGEAAALELQDELIAARERLGPLADVTERPIEKIDLAPPPVDIPDSNIDVQTSKVERIEAAPEPVDTPDSNIDVKPLKVDRAELAPEPVDRPDSNIDVNEALVTPIEAAPAPAPNEQIGQPAPEAAATPESEGEIPVTAQPAIEGFTDAESAEIRQKAASVPQEQLKSWAVGRFGRRSEKASRVEEIAPSLYGDPVAAAADEAATSPTNDRPEPTDAQREAGNYKKGHARIDGFDVTIENPAGSARVGKNAAGKRWSRVMKHHYGYFKRSEGKDGDQVDVFIKKGASSSPKVFVIDQVRSDGTFDEHKVVMGADSEQDARDVYLSNYKRGWDGLGGIAEMSADEFKTWLADPKRTKRPISSDGAAQRAEPEKAAEEPATPPDEQATAKSLPDKSDRRIDTPDPRIDTGDRKEGIISDFGAVLHGARKHYAEALSDKMREAQGLDIATEPLAKTWPEPNYQKLIDEGADPWLVGFIRAARDEIPARPRHRGKLSRHVERVATLRGLANDLLSGDLPLSKLHEKLEEQEFRNVREDVGGRADLYVAVGHDMSLKGIKVRAGSYTFLNGKKYDPPKTFWTVEKRAKKTAFSNWPNEMARGTTKNDAIAAFKDKVEQGEFAKEQKPERQIRFDIYSKRGERGKFFIGKKIGKDYVDLKSFDDVKAARKYLLENKDDLVKRLARFKTIPAHRRDTNAPRVGTDHRNGVDASPEMFADAFGFRGVQFGNYVEGKRRQQDLNESYDALMDLAGVLGVPPRALSLNGELGLAFGARGHGGKRAPSAHYEPGTAVINLTKRSGAGSLAHEWFHSLDNYFSRTAGDSTGYATGGGRTDGVRPAVVEAFQRIKSAIQSIGLMERSKQLDKRRTKAYWSTDIEMTARSFESYVIAKLADQNQANDYLANVVSEEAFGDEAEYPYPTAGEIPAIRAAYDHFFETVETRETDSGVGFFAVRSTPRESWSRTETAQGPMLANDDFTLFPAGVPFAGLYPSGSVVYTIVDTETGKGVGSFVGGMDELGEIDTIYSIVIDDKGKGVGSRIVRAIVANSTGPVTIDNILSSAVGFWQKIGMYDYDGTNAKIDRESFTGSGGKAARGASRKSQSTETDGRNGSVPQEAGSRGSETEQVRSYLESKAGKGAIKRVVDSGKFRIAQSASDADAPPEVRRAARNGETIYGYHDPDTGTSWLFADSLNTTGTASDATEDAYAIFLHEVGVHFGMRDMLGAKLFDDVVAAVEKAADGKLTSAFAQAARAARAAVPEGTPASQVAEETVAWLVTDAANHKLHWVKRIIAKIRAFLVKHGFTKALSTDALAELARGAAMKSGGQHMNSSKAASGEAPKFARARRKYTPEQQAAIDAGKFGAVEKGGLSRQSVKDGIERFRKKWRQGVVDQFDSLRSVLNDNRAWMMAQLSKSDSGALEAIIGHGSPEMVDGALSIKAGTKGLGDILQPLGAEMDDFLRWIAGHRADRLSGEGREHLFDADQIAALKSLNQGTMPDGRNRTEVYESVRKEFEALSDAVVGVAVETGLIAPEQREQWLEEGFYVPFYRMSENDDGARRGPGIATGLAKQRAYKKLKGADIPLNDLLTNVLMNWNHLIGASLRNQAAAKAMETATSMGLAEKVNESQKSKNAIWINEDGNKQWYEFDQTEEAALVLDSLLSLSWEGLNGIGMRAGRAMKRALTIGVTVSPEFRVANLLRDTIHSVAVADMDVNIVKNVASGWKGTRRGSETQVAMLAGGGAFGTSGYIDGADPEAVKRLVKKGVDEDTILTTAARLGKVWDWYQEWGARAENINRAAAYKTAIERGADNLEANFAARDLLDFSRTGSFVAVRAVAQLVPFLNARLQGLDKMGRAVANKKQRAQFAAVTAVYSLASVMLYLMMRDDDDYKEAEQWERDAYHLFKLPGSDVMYRFPRPFEVGTIATIMERITEQAVDDDVHGKLFAERLWHALTETLAFNPIPQIVKPAVEVFANRNMHTGNSIESMSMERLSPSERKRAWTSETAISASDIMDKVSFGKVVLSPVQIEHLVRGYFGWGGAFVLGAVDTLFTRPLTGAPEDPAKKFYEAPVMKRFVRSNPTRHSKYVSTFYDQLRSVNQIYADTKQAEKLGEFAKMDKLLDEHGDMLTTRKYLNRVSRRLSKINAEMTLVYSDREMDAEAKRKAMDELLKERNKIAREAVADTRKFFR